MESHRVVRASVTATLVACLALLCLAPPSSAEPEPRSPLALVIAGASGTVHPGVLLEPSWPGLHALARCARETLAADEAPDEILVRIDLVVHPDSSVSDIELVEVIPEELTSPLRDCFETRAGELVMAAGERDGAVEVSLRLQLTPEGAAPPRFIPAPRPGEQRGAIAVLNHTMPRIDTPPAQGGEMMAIGARSAQPGPMPNGNVQNPGLSGGVLGELSTQHGTMDAGPQPQRDCGAASVRCLPPAAEHGGPNSGADSEVSIVPGNITILGQMEESVFRRVLRERRRAFRACVVSGHAQGELSSGRLSIQAVVNPDGEVPVATVLERTGGVQAVESCILERVRQLQFPEPHGGGVVRATFSFTVTVPE